MRGGYGPAALVAALVKVLVQEVEAAGGVESTDLLERVLDWHPRPFDAASAQVLAVGVDQAGPVLARATESVGLGRARIAFDRIEPQIEPSCKVAEADTVADQVVDGVPVFQGGAFAVSVRRFGPAIVHQSLTCVASGRARRIALA